MSQANKEIIINFIEEIWNQNHLAQLDTYLAAEYYDYTYEPRNREGFERALATMKMAFPDHRITIEEIVAEGDVVGVCHTWHGTHTGTPFRGIPASGKSFEIGGYRFYKLRDGKIISHRGLIDITSMIQQLSTPVKQ